MSYFRGEIYTWGSKDRIYFDKEGFSIGWTQFDAVALMRVAELLANENPTDLQSAIAFIDEHARGNFGSFDWFTLAGEDPEGEFRARFARAAAGENT